MSVVPPYSSSSPSPPPSSPQPRKETDTVMSAAGDDKNTASNIDIQRPFQAINSNEAIIAPYERYRQTAEDFESQVAERMQDLLLNFRAWAEARPSAEDVRGENEVRAELEAVQARETSQGSLTLLEQTRRKVVSFIASVRQAIADLAG